MIPNDLPPATFDEARSYVVKGSTLNTILAAIRKRTPVAGANINLQEGPDGFLIAGNAGGDGAASGPCPFGSFTDGPGADEATIFGGALTAGATVFDVADETIDTSLDDSYLVWIEVDLTAVTQDGVLLPGIASASAPTWGTGSSYPSQTLPTNATPTGTAIVPLGSIDIVSGEVFFQPEGCGSITLSHCPGSLSASRN